MSSSKTLFIDPNEIEIANLKSGSINPSGSVGGSYCLLSNKRVYYKGAAVAFNGSQIVSLESVIDLKSITGTAFSVRRLPGLLIIGILFLLTAIAGLLLEPLFEIDILTANELGYLPYVVGGIAILFILLYIFIRKKIFSIMYSCGELSFPASISTVKTIRAFCSKIHAVASIERAKDVEKQSTVKNNVPCEAFAAQIQTQPQVQPTPVQPEATVCQVEQQPDHAAEEVPAEKTEAVNEEEPPKPAEEA